MSRPKVNRRTARINAMQMLYQADLNPELERREVLRYFHEQMRSNEQMRSKELEAFALRLFEGVRNRLPEIDALLEAVSENWRLGRMAPVDRAILRLATYEIRFGECPPKVAINEAIEIAKKFAAAESPSYINGVLDRILKSRSTETEASPIS